MATKTSLLSAINAQITAIITQAKHRLAMSLMLDELYPSVIHDTEATTNIFTASNAANITYNLRIVKQGRCVTIKGRFKNATNQIVSNVAFATITTPEYLPSETTIYFGFGMLGPVSFVLGTNGVLSIVSAMGASSEMDINFTYFTLN